MPGTSLCSRSASRWLVSGKTPTRTGIGHLPPSLSTNASRYVEVEDDLRHRELRSRFELLLEPLELDVDVVGASG